MGSKDKSSDCAGGVEGNADCRYLRSTINGGIRFFPTCTTTISQCRVYSLWWRCSNVKENHRAGLGTIAAHFYCCSLYTISQREWPQATSIWSTGIG